MPKSMSLLNSEDMGKFWGFKRKYLASNGRGNSVVVSSVESETGHDGVRFRTILRRSRPGEIEIFRRPDQRLGNLRLSRSVFSEGDSVEFFAPSGRRHSPRLSRNAAGFERPPQPLTRARIQILIRLASAMRRILGAFKVKRGVVTTALIKVSGPSCFSYVSS